MADMISLQRADRRILQTAAVASVFLNAAERRELCVCCETYKTLDCETVFGRMLHKQHWNRGGEVTE